MLSEYVRADGSNVEAPYGLFFSDSAPSMLTTIIQSEVIPPLDGAGVKVAFCDLSKASIADAPSLVHRALTLLDGFEHSVYEAASGLPGKRRVGAYAVDEDFEAQPREESLPRSTTAQPT